MRLAVIRAVERMRAGQCTESICSTVARSGPRRLCRGAERGGVALLRRLDQVAELVMAALPDQLDRVGVAVDDRLEELLAVLVGAGIRFGFG